VKLLKNHSKSISPTEEKARKKFGKFPKLKERIIVQDDGESNWLTSYADMMTLLVGFFVLLMTAMKFDVSKLELIKRETAKSMGGTYERPYQDLVASLKSLLFSLNLKDQITVTEMPDGATLSVHGPLFFASGSAELKQEAQALLSQLSEVLTAKAKDFRIVVEGHTDDQPMSSERYPSNWELSSARAGTVVRILESRGFAHSALRPVGLADTEPLLPNRNKQGEVLVENQAKNRRILIRIQKLGS